ncbi:MAG: DUF262 domain-containing HNH endonuclease family protein [Thermodesulfobacteriota bacterium]
MAATNFNTENRTYRQLLGNGLTYLIPRFQRDYSWGEEEWEDLWADILGTLPADGEPAHYMGYLVLRTTDNRVFEVIDGQQRLTTISLIALATMRLLKRSAAEGGHAAANQKRLDQLRASYIGYLDPVTLTARNKLSLNRNNDPYYRDYLVPLADHLPQRGFPASTHAMRKAFEWLERRLREHVKGQIDPGVALAQFVETMSDKLFFTVITVADELNAYKVFETLNARGVRLSATDLLKNYLFSVLARDQETQHQMDELERRWEAMVGRLGSESFPDFLRMHWNSRQSFARQSELFKTIRHRIQNREAVFALLRDMDEDIDTYLALTQPEGAQWPPTWRQSAQELRMFSVRQPFPMLMAARRRLADSDFEGLLRATVVIAFRYNVVGAQHTGEQERVYHSVAAQLHRGEAATLAQVLEGLRPIYRGDDAFRADFAEKSVKTTQSRNAKIVRYVLGKLERQAGGIDFDPDSPAYTIEHVLPQSPEVGWDTFHDRDLGVFVFRLANMVMLETGKNRDLGNRPYAEKRPVLQTSAVLLTRTLAEENAEWTPERLDARQRQLANLATAVWRVAQLS